MPMLFNGTHIPPAQRVMYNGTRLRRVVYHGVTVWLANVTLKNSVSDADEKAIAWSDVGHIGGRWSVADWTAQAGRQYYVRTNFSYFAYGPLTPDDNWWVTAIVRLDDTEIISRTQHGWPHEPPITFHTILNGDGAQHTLSLSLDRYNSAQGSISTAQTMVVDITETGLTSADEIWSKTKFFRGTKQIQL